MKFPHSSYDFLVEFMKRATFSLRSIVASLGFHVSHVIGMRAVAQMMRVKTNRTITVMECIADRPSSMEQEEGSTVRPDDALLTVGFDHQRNGDAAVTVLANSIRAIWPVPACFNIGARLYLLLHPSPGGVLLRRAVGTVLPLIHRLDVQRIDAAQVAAYADALGHRILAIMKKVGEAVGKLFASIPSDECMVVVDQEKRPLNTAIFGWILDCAQKPALLISSRMFGGHRLSSFDSGVLGLESFTAAQGLIC